MYNDEKEIQHAIKLYDTTPMKDLHLSFINTFERRVAYNKFGIGTNYDSTMEEFNTYLTMGLNDEIHRAYNMIWLSSVSKDSEYPFGIRHYQHCFYQTEDGQLRYIAPNVDGQIVFRMGDPISWEDGEMKIIDISMDELDQFTKIELKALSKISYDDFYGLYVWVGKKLDARFDAIIITPNLLDSMSHLISKDLTLIKNSVQDNMLSKLKLSIHDDIQIGVVSWIFNGTEYSLYPVNDYATYCLMYDKQKVIYTSAQMKIFIDNLVKDQSGIDHLNNVHYVNMIPEDVEQEFVLNMMLYMDTSGPHYDYKRFVLTPYGKYLAYKQIINAGFDNEIIRFCHFDLMDGMAQLYLSKVEPNIEITYMAFYMKSPIIYKGYKELFDDIFNQLKILEAKVLKYDKAYIKKVENQQIVDIFKHIKVSNNPLAIHLKNAWNEYLNKDETLTRSIITKFGKILQQTHK